MTKRVALMLPLAVAAAVTHTRRATLKHTAYAVAAAAAPASAKELYYTKEEFCRISDEQSKNGIEFGCEQYVASPEKRARMRLRALDAITRASEKLDTYRVEMRDFLDSVEAGAARGPSAWDGYAAQAVVEAAAASAAADGVAVGVDLPIKPALYSAYPSPIDKDGVSP